MFKRRAGLRSGGPPPPPADAAAPKNSNKAAPVVVAASHRGVATVAVAKPAAAAKPAAEAASEAECYERAMKPLLFDEAPLGDTHAFKAAAAAQGAASGEQQRQRATRIVAELAGLREALPCHLESLVAVRIDAMCADMLRACVLGADGTPYAGGCFVFDILLPTAFPAVPPQVKFLTTGGGGWRANPNLYANGTVCLSLIGTWAGPGWEPARSTLLQLLVSLQGLVLNREPYYNEPGYEGSRGTPAGAAASKEYNHGVRAGTMSHAVAAPLHELFGQAAAPASPAAPFAALLREHFSRKAATLRATAAAWEAEAAAHAMSPGAKAVPAAAAAVRAALDRVPQRADAEQREEAPPTPKAITQRRA